MQLAAFLQRRDPISLMTTDVLIYNNLSNFEFFCSRDSESLIFRQGGMLHVLGLPFT